LPLLAGVILLKLDAPVLMRVASRLRSGDTFVVALTMMLVSAPITIVNSAISQPTIPELVRLTVDPAPLRKTYLRALELGLLVVAPASVIFIVDAWQLVELLFRRGRFGSEAVGSAAAITAIWGGASWFLTSSLYCEDVLAACGEARRTLVVRAAYLPSLVAVVLLGEARWGLTGIIGGYVAVNFIRFLVLGELARRVSRTSFATQWGSVGRIAIAAAAAGVYCVLLDRLVGFHSDLARLAFHGVGVLLVFLVAASILRVKTVSEIWSLLGLRKGGLATNTDHLRLERREP
jgi:peptidoglycan biosynthesis protein MviN/MurJ (putative lipid II flippase)